VSETTWIAAPLLPLLPEMMLLSIVTVFTPTTADLPNTALELTYQGTSGAQVDVLLDGIPLGQLQGTGVVKTERICLPEWARGSEFRIKFVLFNRGITCANPDVRDFYLDDLTFVSDTLCLDGAQLVDGGFEGYGSDITSSFWFRKNLNNSTNPNIDVRVLNSPSLARSGNYVLRAQGARGCTDVYANTTMQVPAPASDAGPALRYFYQLPAAASTIFSVCLQTIASFVTDIECQTLSEAADYTEMTLCIDPVLSGRTLNVQVMADGEGNCSTDYIPEPVYVDDMAVVTDDGCPY